MAVGCGARVGSGVCVGRGGSAVGGDVVGSVVADGNSSAGGVGGRVATNSAVGICGALDCDGDKLHASDTIARTMKRLINLGVCFILSLLIHPMDNETPKPNSFGNASS